jgi:hypothetical protein
MEERIIVIDDDREITIRSTDEDTFVLLVMDRIGAAVVEMSREKANELLADLTERLS